MEVRLKIILITLPFVVNLIQKSSESSHNSTANRAERTTEAHGGFLRGKFKEWRARCRKKVEFFRAKYNSYKLRKEKAPSIANEVDRQLVNHTEFCARPIGNASNFPAEIKKQTSTSMPEITTSVRQSRLKEVLDKCTRPEYSATAGIPNTMPRSNMKRKMNALDFSNRLRFGTPNAEGKMVVYEFYMDLIPTANLSTLINWLHQAEDLTSAMQIYKEEDTELLRQIFNMPAQGGLDPKEMIESIIDFTRRFEFLIQRELRKPEKEWNYSAEKD